MATLLLCLALQETRVTLELADVPLSDAAAHALKPFGHTAEWIKEPEASRRVWISLKDAGYFKTIDTLCGLAAQPPAEYPHHQAYSRRVYCGMVDFAVRTVAVLDLTEAIRLIVDRRGFHTADVRLTVFSLPGPRPACQLEDLEINGAAAPHAAQFLGWSGLNSYPVELMFGGSAPRQVPGEIFQVRGTLVFEGRRMPFDTGHVVLLPHPELEGEEAPRAGWTRRQLWTLLIVGVGFGALLIVGGLGLLRIKLDAS